MGGRASSRGRPWARVAAALVGVPLSIAFAAAPAGAAVSHELLGGNGDKRETLERWSGARIDAAQPTPPELEASAVSAGDRRDGPGAIGPEPPASTAAAGRARAAGGFGTYEVPDSASAPNTATGLILYRTRRGLWGCSGTAVSSRTEKLVFTAGHCAYSIREGWSRELVFIPSYRDGATPYGVWAASELWVPGAWHRRENLAYDFGIAAIAPLHGATLQDVVGSFGLAWNQRRKQTYRAFGYPSNHFGGERMMGCLSPFVRSGPYLGRAERQIGIRCDFESGSSGGGWLVDDRYLNSVVSGSYRAQPGILYGPYFGNAAARLHARADRG
jgi:V8-like Glu-specific endopeptidase